MSGGRTRAALFVLIAVVLLAGCGNGLSISVVADPISASPGQSVSWDVKLTNTTQCALVNDADLPPPLPLDLPPLAIFIGFDPTFEVSPAAVCQALSACQDITCLEAFMGSSAGARIEAVREAAREMAREAASLSGPPIPPAECVILDNDDVLGVLGGCFFDNLAPGAMQTLTVSDLAPNTGNRSSFQIALALAAARGSDCGPGIDLGEDTWLVGGCAAISDSAPAPLLSPAGVALLLAALCLTAAFGLRRRRRT